MSYEPRSWLKEPHLPFDPGPRGACFRTHFVWVTMLVDEDDLVEMGPRVARELADGALDSAPKFEVWRYRAQHHSGGASDGG